MAHLLIQTDPIHPGRWTLQSDNPSVLAAIPDALVQVLDLGDDVLGAWALHPDEQNGGRDAAYHDELHELGIQSVVEVRELARPWQQNVVWVDRYHLLVGAANPAVGSRLLGLYVGSKGRIVISMFHPSVTALVQSEYDTMPNENGRDWDRQQHIANARFALRYDPEQPNAVQMRCPQSMAHSVQGALGRLTQMVAGW